MKTFLGNLISFLILVIILISFLSFLNFKYSGNPIYHRLGVNTDHLKYFKKDIYNLKEEEYLNFFAKKNTKEYLNHYKKVNNVNKLYSSKGADINLIFYLDKNNCRENRAEDYSNTDIVLLGDSYLWGVSINNPFDISGRLRAYFPEKSILNLGAPGSGPVNQLKRLKSLTQNKNFKNLVWFFYEGNDYQESTINNQTKEVKKCNSIGKDIEENFNIINYSPDKYGYYIKIKIFLSEYLRGLNSFIKLYKNYNNKYELNERDFNITLNDAKKYLESKKINRKLIYYIPSYSSHSYKKNANHPQLNKVKKLKNKVKQIALKNDFEFIDGNIYLDEVENRMHLYHYGYPTHFNSLGYKLIADQVFNTLN